MPADCYLPGRSELARWELAHPRQLTTPFGSYWFSPPEAIIAHKLLFYREGRSEKHLEDIRSILSATPQLDGSALTRWIDHLGLQPEWQQIPSTL